VMARQPLVDHHGVFRRHRGRKGVHDEKEAQGFLRYQRTARGMRRGSHRNWTLGPRRVG
jgi:hypothetical protein